MFHLRLQIGVMGGAFVYTQVALRAAYLAGVRIAEKRATLVTGATTGVPYAAAIGAKDGGGMVVGISPGANATEHVHTYSKPLSALDAIVYTGMGYNGREPINVATCDGVLCIGGEFGTLAEFSHAFYEGRPLGVLTGVGGISDRLRQIVEWTRSDHGSKIAYETDPELLVDRVIDLVVNAAASAVALGEGADDAGEDVRAAIADIRTRPATSDPRTPSAARHLQNSGVPNKQ